MASTSHSLDTAVASSSTLWATASKEWVIPAKPKPGRKPKLVGSSKEAEEDELAELQARIKQYEKGEIERNVTLQNISKRLKEENEQLRKENLALKERVAVCEAEHLTTGGENMQRKRRRDKPFGSSPDEEERTAKRARAGNHPPANTLAASSYPSPASMASPPEFIDSPATRSSPTSLPVEHSLSHFGPADGDVVDPMDAGQDQNPFTDTSCGLCSDETDCFCRNMMREVSNEPLLTVPLRMEHFEHRKSEAHLPGGPAVPVETPSADSLLNKPHVYQPAVPLRRRAATSAAKPIFELLTAVPSPSALPTCSGDPKNCMACADDSFGQAFCAAVGESASTAVDCENCPCRDGELAEQSSPANSRHGVPDTISTDKAWRKIKSHPNVAFADLTLLADVVARRTKCTGPRVVISPALGSATPDRIDSPVGVTPTTSVQDSIDRSIHGKRAAGTPPRLVPQEVLIECGRRRVREVRADAVKEALRMLDARNRFV
ncbi:hypothetical protein HWV62_35604 [Athelia sp. TMB]|nr:hypothetical protein HWV62_35604 [Athelia sp. TMB]